MLLKVKPLIGSAAEAGKIVFSWLRSDPCVLLFKVKVDKLLLNTVKTSSIPLLFFSPTPLLSVNNYSRRKDQRKRNRQREKKYKKRQKHI